MKFQFDNERPIYIQLVEMIKEEIIAGVYKPGSRLPSVREFATMASVNPNTVQRSLQELESEKLIITRRTNGKFVTEDEKLLEKVKGEVAFRIIRTYLSNMKRIGIPFSESVSYLQKLGGKIKK